MAFDPHNTRAGSDTAAWTTYSFHTRNIFSTFLNNTRVIHFLLISVGSAGY